MIRRDAVIGNVLESIVMWSRILAASNTGPFGDILLTRSQVDALFLIAHVDSRMTLRGLAGQLGLTAGAVTQLIDRLSEAGLVTRQINPRDRRSRIVVLTPAASEQVAAFEADIITRVSAQFADLTDGELTMLAALINRTTHLTPKRAGARAGRSRGSP